MATITTTAVPPTTQYQHFVPQFLLRNFSHPYKPAGGRKRGRRKDENGLYRGESVVHVLDFTAEPPVICEKPVKRVLGQVNMYEEGAGNARGDRGATKREQRVEEMLSKLEGQAAQVFRKITKAYEDLERDRQAGGDVDKVGAVCLARSERDLIRKFLFLLKYRGSTFHRRFYHQTPHDYNSNDAKALREYMADKGYTRPLDVWLDNIKAIIELEMDLEGKWHLELCRRMYPADAQWFFAHNQMFYMAICTPASPDYEFILTDSSYNVYEGPNTCARNHETGNLEGSSWTELHMFAPVSPRLMIVLRSYLFPEPLEDDNRSVRQERERARRQALDRAFGGEVKGMLHDLPVSKARNNYSRVGADGKLIFDANHDGTRKAEHKFYFTLFPIGARHVNIINGVLLGNCRACTSVVFLTKSVFARTLEWFLGTDSINKVVAGVPDADSHAESFRKMEIVSRALGSTGRIVTSVVNPPPEVAEAADAMHHFLGLQEEGLRNWFQKVVIKGEEDPFQKSEFMRLYMSLGGHPWVTLMDDFDQAYRMWTLRVKIDAWSNGVAEPIRQRNRDLLEAAYMRLPAARFLIYAKYWRAKMLFRLEGDVKGDAVFGGPENILLGARNIFRRDTINRAIYNVVSTDIRRGRGLWRNPWEALTGDFSKGLETLDSLSYVTDVPGHICECGIPEIEQLADEVQLRIVTAGLYNTSADTHSLPFRLLEDEEKVELMTRAFVKAKFGEVMKGKLGASEVGPFSDVLFDYGYPTPPLEWFKGVSLKL